MATHGCPCNHPPLHLLLFLTDSLKGNEQRLFISIQNRFEYSGKMKYSLIFEIELFIKHFYCHGVNVTENILVLLCFIIKKACAGRKDNMKILHWTKYKLDNTVEDLRFSRQRVQRWPSSGLLCCIV